MLHRIAQWLGGRQTPLRQPERLRLHAARWPAVIYAVGDVHGSLALLVELERQIVNDAEHIVGEKWIVMLGDYIDRGGESAGVLDHLMRPPPTGFQRYCLTGNHEVMMVNFIAEPSMTADWLRWGGAETLASYGITMASLQRASARQLDQVLQSHIPASHQEFIASLPVALAVPGTIFVHAGLRPSSGLEDQADHDLMWHTWDDADAAAHGSQRIVHGHTPHAHPLVTANRIDVDTGAFATGKLTAVRLTEDGHYRFLAATHGRRSDIF